MARKRKSKAKRAATFQQQHMANNIVYIAVGLFFLSTSIFSQNIGMVGEPLLYLFKGLFGDVLVIVAIISLLMGIYGFITKENRQRFFHIGMFLVLSGIFIAYQIPHLERFSYMALVEAFELQHAGGLIGALIADAVYLTFGTPGIYILMFGVFAVGAALLVNSISTLGRIKDYSAQVLLDIQEERQIKKEIIGKQKLLEKKERQERIKKDYENQFLNNTGLSRSDFEALDEGKTRRKINIKGHDFPEFNLEVEEKKPAEENKSISEPRSIVNRPKGGSSARPITRHVGKWLLPPASLLANVKKEREYNSKSELEHTARLLEETLRSFGINIQVKDVSCGPAITRYEAVLEPGTKVSKIVGLSEDIALALAATSVRIEAPIPGKSAVGFEIPNKKVSAVSFKEIVLSTHFKDVDIPLTMGIGRDLTGKTVATSLVDMPHLLIAGSTGSGKSVCLNTIICSLLYKYTPDELKLLLIDPKKVEMTPYNDIPHLVAPVVTEPKKASVALKWMVNEMENRYQQLSVAGVKDIKAYNESVIEKERMPYIIIIIDELADLMMAAPVDVETYICRIAQKARAAGIHLIVATQRPSVQVITGDIKSNIPMRIAFAVFSQIDARTILDTTGAEKLLGKGDMLFTQKGGKLLRVQGAYISEEEIDEVTNFLKKQGKPEYLQGADILDRLEEDGDGHNGGGDFDDELLKDAARMVLETNQASISMLQRKLRIGYSRAARIIDILEEHGFVGPFEGTKSREVKAGWDDFNRLFGD